MEGDELETVQYKFASIIGGLCGKPKIMSQFAVWLDLRLAEYKLKGAISLDCSGCRPDPDWLNGIKPDFTFIDQERFNTREIISCETLSPQQEPDTVIVKQEDINRSESLTCMSNQKDIYPISLHDFQKHQYKQSRLSPHNSPETLSTNTPSTSHSCPSDAKIRKICEDQHKEHETSDAEISPMNESLISLISPEQEAIVLDEDDNTESRLADRSSDAADRLHESASASHYPATPPAPEQMRICAWPIVSSLLQRAYRPMGPVVGPSGPVLNRSTIRHYDNFSRRDRLPHYQQLPVKTVRNMVAAVGSFERWLWSSRHEDMRQIQEIPPEQLDPYLSEYFSTVKKPCGEDYTPASFVSLRASLDRYLKEMRYSEFIVSSPLFHGSIRAFRARRKKLLFEQNCPSN